MTDTYVNLNIHSYPEIPGKVLRLAGAEYIFLELLGEGAEKVVYPLKNKKSGLIMYVGKIYKLRPDSPILKDIIASLPWKLFDLVIPQLILYTEFHEIPGAVMEIQPYGRQDNPEFHKEQMDPAIELLKGQRWNEAVDALGRVLHSNPNHSIAMLNLALAYLNMGRVEEAIELAENSISIEPNFPDAYRLLSSIYLQLGHPEEALEPLRRTLDRFNCDPETWQALLDIAVGYDLVDVAEEALQEVNRLGARESGETPRPFAHFAGDIEQSKTRRNEYDLLLSRALSLQMKNSWNEALTSCSHAMKTSKNNRLATLNYYVCNYHLGRAREIAGELYGSLYRWAGMELAAAAALAMLCLHQANDPKTARRIALWIASRYDHHVDIPAIPVGISVQRAILEDKSGKPIIDMLTFLERDCTGEEARKIAHLKKLYMKREVEFNKP